MTLAEQRLWKVLRRLDIHARRQAPVGRYVVDFVSHGANLVIEVDGPIHDLFDVPLRDEKRDAWLRSQGYQVLRVRNQQVFEDIEGVVALILDSLPPRWGKGRDGGVRADIPGSAQEAGRLQRHSFQRRGPHPNPCPAPIDGAGALESDENGR